MRRRWLGLGITVGVALVSMLLARTLLSPFLPILGALYGLTLASVVYAAYSGGLRVGLASGAVGAAYAFVHYLGLDEIFPQTLDRVMLASAVAALTIGMASMVGLLSDKAQRSLTAERKLSDALQRKNRELEESNKALRELNETLDSFSYVVSHDLKEPVRALHAYSTALQEDHERNILAAEARELVRRNVETSKRLARLLDGLLEFSSVARDASGESRAITVQEALSSDECAARFADVAQERRANVDLVPGPPFLAALPSVCQILGNLVLNAIKHNDSAAPHVRVTPRAYVADAKFVEVVVEDNGRGFPDAVASQFRRSRPERPSTIGGGFGLLITRRAVERLGGAIWVERSKDLGGAAVHLTLPAAGLHAKAPDGIIAAST